VAKRRRTAGRAGKNNEAELARAVQQSLLAVPRAQGPTFELVARFAPAEEVAGDFYDLFLFGPELLGFYLGDVQGKGLAAAMYAARDLRERKLTYANAGLPYPLLSRGGVVTRVELDGLTDSLENRCVRDGEAVVRRVLESRRAGSAEGLADRLLEQLPRARNRRSAQADDASFLVLRIL